jgi:hypothetical protein
MKVLAGDFHEGDHVIVDTGTNGLTFEKRPAAEVGR